MKRVTLVNPPQNKGYSQPPMGLALLAGVLEREGYQVKVLDANAQGLSITDIISCLSDVDVIGVTAMTPTINNALSILKYAKRVYPDSIVMLGGPHATLLPEDVVRDSPYLDVLVTGEGEYAILDAIKEGKRGIVHNDKPVDMDSLPYLAYHLLPWQTYRPHPPHGRALPFLAMISSRGCPYHCCFCSKPVFGYKFRAQSSERVVDEIMYYRREFGVKEIAFYDDVFTLDKKRAYAIAETMLRKNVKVSWTCETRVNLVDKDLLKHMKRAGCYSVAYGIESGAEEVLAEIDKDITLDQVERAVRMTREAGIQTIGYFMIGSPNETHESAAKTIKVAKKLGLDYAQFSITTPFPGTKLWEQRKDNLNVSWDKFSYAGIGSKVSPICESNGMSRDDIESWVHRAYKEFYFRPSYVWQRLTEVRNVGDVRVLAKGLSMLTENVKHG